MSLYFIRHGESEANEQNRFAGKLETPLTVLGERQAGQAGDRVAGIGIRFDEIHVSTLGRARRTADIVRAHLADPPDRVVVAPALVERDFGVFGGQNKSLVKKLLGYRDYTWYFHDHAGKAPGGEAWQEMYERVRQYYFETLLPASRAGRNILVVSHKYVIEMFALVVAGKRVEEYHDLKVPNGKPLSVDDLRGLTRPSSRWIDEVGEIVEIRLPALLVAVIGLGIFAGLLTTARPPSWVFPALVVVLMGTNSFFGILRVNPAALRGSVRTFRGTLPLLALRAITGVWLTVASHDVRLVLVGLFLLMPPALASSTLSLLWGGNYFLALRYTIAASVILPVMIAGAVGLSQFVPQSTGLITLDDLRPALGMFAVVLVLALVVPGVSAQVYRRRQPIAAGGLSTNWGWLGSACLVPLAGVAAFVLAPRHAGALLAHVALGDLVVPMLVAFALPTALRLAPLVFLRFRSTSGAMIRRDIYITHSTPNVFLWLSMAAALATSSKAGPGLSELSELVLCTFFLGILADEMAILRRFRRRLWRVWNQPEPTASAVTREVAPQYAA